MDQPNPTTNPEPKAKEMVKNAPLGRDTLDDVARAEAEGMMSHPENRDPIEEAFDVRDERERARAAREADTRSAPVPWIWIASGASIAVWLVGFFGFGATESWIHAFLMLGMLLALFGVLGWDDEKAQEPSGRRS